jgi:hypothetical protein
VVGERSVSGSDRVDGDEAGMGRGADMIDVCGDGGGYAV